MNLKDIVSVSGLPGLFRIAGNRSNGLIIEDLDSGKRKFAPSRSHQFSPLESIAIFTTTEEDSIELGKVFDKIKAALEQHPLIDANASPEASRAYFKAVFPEHDEDRVKISDIKKVLKWFQYLMDRNLLSEEETEEQPTP
ncbi:MAG: DUF5606 domain-containing protein [Saprospirales bacterium]|nr:DUF5606 domain-containing protein [Saprospirales bacterium]MBK6901596.1 DUF5606 domain-containing protein [Saprospirales bacterium]MBK7335518.1 DUF5606 domain-containing protein [Saprospirales bacterium]